MIRQKWTTENFITKAREVHGNKYGYELTEYVNQKIKLKVNCPIHGTFKQFSYHHIRGHGCKQCAMPIAGIARDNANKERLKAGIRIKSLKSIDQFVAQARNTHGEFYDYSKSIYTGNHTKLTIICPKHGSFLQAPSKHINMKRGCSKCGRQSSHISSDWLDSLCVPLREYCLLHRHRIVDGYAPTTNTVYQFHGDFFHGNPAVYKPDKMNPLTKETFGDLYQQTLRLDQEIRDLGYNLIVMWENDWLSINNLHRNYKARSILALNI